jgi:heavy metal sensor kinase
MLEPKKSKSNSTSDRRNKNSSAVPYLTELWRQIDLSSLRSRLTLVIAAVSALGLSSLAIWTSWKMQRLLIATHKNNLEYIADRFPHDVKIYSQMMVTSKGIQKAIDNVTTDNTLLWVKDSQNQIIARSIAIQANSQANSLLLLKNIEPIPELKQVNGRYWLLCVNSLQVDREFSGRVYIAQDITSEYSMFLEMLRNLMVASLLSLTAMTIAIAWYVQKSLYPLQRLSQLTEKISADRLGKEYMQLTNAPTEVKELAQTFDRMLIRLSEAWDRQRELIANVSHELRTPLTLVSGYLQSTLRRGNNLTEMQKEALIIASAEADRTIQLMQDLLDLARADSGGMHFQMQPLILNEFILELASMAKKYSDRQINLESPSEAIVIKADSNRLRQVLLNLIDNAVKYSPAETPVTVKIARREDSIEISVCDRGVGIPLQQQSRIFERFYRLDESRSRAVGGTGLGLSIVKTLVEGMGGTISVRSQLDRGSTFTVTFPAIEPIR